jgi:hypothetical protein
MAKSCLFNRWRSKKGFCNGKESFEAHLKRIEPNLPEKGDVHVLTFTDRASFPSQLSINVQWKNGDWRFWWGGSRRGRRRSLLGRVLNNSRGYATTDVNACMSAILRRWTRDDKGDGSHRLGAFIEP